MDWHFRASGLDHPGPDGMKPAGHRLVESVRSVLSEFDVPSCRTRAVQQTGWTEEVDRQN